MRQLHEQHTQRRRVNDADFLDFGLVAWVCECVGNACSDDATTGGAVRAGAGSFGEFTMWRSDNLAGGGVFRGGVAPAHGYDSADTRVWFALGVTVVNRERRRCRSARPRTELVARRGAG